MEYTSVRWSSDWHMTWTDYSSPIKSANMWLCGNLWQGLSLGLFWVRKMNSRVDWNGIMAKSSKSCKFPSSVVRSCSNSKRYGAYWFLDSAIIPNRQEQCSCSTSQSKIHSSPSFLIPTGLFVSKLIRPAWRIAVVSTVFRIVGKPRLS